MTGNRKKHPKGLLDRLFFWRKAPPSAVMFVHGSKKPVPLPKWTFPEGLVVQTDTSPAQWIQESLPRYPWATVGSIIPSGFAAYARVLHPAHEQGQDKSWTAISWSEIAERNGKVIHPLVQFERIAGLSDDPNDHPPGIARPPEGDLPSELIEPLIQNLRRFTRTPEACLFLLWKGYGDLQMLEGFDSYPEVEVPGREYLLISGNLEGFNLFEAKRSSGGPNLWWPEDRSWCVATEIDLDSTLVGGSDKLIRELLSDPDVEAVPARLEDSVAINADTINE
jgi:hypothetical protein